MGPGGCYPFTRSSVHLCLPLSRCEQAGGLGTAAGTGVELGALREVLARLGCGGATAGVGAAQPQGGTTWKGVERDEEEEKVLDANLPLGEHANAIMANGRLQKQALLRRGACSW